MVAVLAVRNRRDVTARGLRALDVAAVRAGVRLRRVVVDDGSTDGTGALLRAVLRPDDVLVEGDGGLYWAGGMRRGLAELPAMVPYDHVLLLNDDVRLHETALLDLLARTDGQRDRLVVGQVVDPLTGAPSYGGYRGRTRTRPFGYRLTTDPEGQLDTMNGNVVLVGGDALDRLGGLSPRFRHGFADFDLGLRANDLGLAVLLSRRPVGTCPRNPLDGTWRDQSLGRWTRLRLMSAPTAMPPREWASFAWRHGGVYGLRHVVWDVMGILRGRPTGH